MGEFAKQTQSYNEQLTQVREEVERLEFCLEGLCAERTSGDSDKEYISILAVSQGFSLPAPELY